MPTTNCKCGNEIAEARSKLGYTTCIECGDLEAQAETNRKKQRVGISYNKGGYTYLGEPEAFRKTLQTEGARKHLPIDTTTGKRPYVERVPEAQSDRRQPLIEKRVPTKESDHQPTMRRAPYQVSDRQPQSPRAPYQASGQTQPSRAPSPESDHSQPYNERAPESQSGSDHHQPPITRAPTTGSDHHQPLKQRAPHSQSGQPAKKQWEFSHFEFPLNKLGHRTKRAVLVPKPPKP